MRKFNEVTDVIQIRNQNRKRRDRITKEEFEHAYRQLAVQKHRRPSIRELAEKLEGGSTTTIRRFLADMPGTETWKRVRRKSTLDMYFRDPQPSFRQLSTAYNAVVLGKFETVWPGADAHKQSDLAGFLRIAQAEVWGIARGERVLDVREFVVWCVAAKLDPATVLQELIDTAKVSVR